jgi:hypothetical protein
MRRIAAVIAGSVTLLVVLGGCGTPLSDSLVGTWQTDLNGVYVDFRTDGTYQVTPTRYGGVRLESGTWSVEGSTLTQTPVSDSEYCADIVATYEVEVVDDGDRLEATAVDDSCPDRLRDFGSGLTRVVDAES